MVVDTIVRYQNYSKTSEQNKMQKFCLIYKTERLHQDIITKQDYLFHHAHFTPRVTQRPGMGTAPASMYCTSAILFTSA